MYQRLGVVHLDGYARAGEQFAVPDAVVAQRVVAGDRDVGGWQAGEVRRPAGHQPAGGSFRSDHAGVPAGEFGDGVERQDRARRRSR